MDCSNEDLLNVCRIRHFCNLKFKCTLIGNVNTYNSKKEKWPRRKYNLLKDVKENYSICYCKKSIDWTLAVLNCVWTLAKLNENETLSIKTCMYSFYNKTIIISIRKNRLVLSIA